MGDNCRVSAHSTISGRSSGQHKPQLIVGNNVDISWQNEIFVGRKITIGDNVRMAVKVRLIGYPGHPIDAEDRARRHRVIWVNSIGMRHSPKPGVLKI